jgi:ABC-2 type transport system ATP-binding protein
VPPGSVWSPRTSRCQDLSCRQNLDFFASLYGLDRASRRLRVEQALQEFELFPYADQPAGQLSGGWRRRLHVALGVVHQPRLLILDEPTASIDLAARHALWQIIRRQRDAGTTVLLTTHHLDEAEQLCDRIGILHDGRLLVEGTPEAIRTAVLAEQIALLDAADLQPLRERAGMLGLRCRDIGGRLGVLLPNSQTLAEIFLRFDGMELRSLAVSPVTLEHAYLQLLGADAA